MAGTEPHTKVGTTRTSERVGPDPDTQRVAPPTAPGAPAQQNERITQPQRKNLVPRPDSDIQTPTEREPGAQTRSELQENSAPNSPGCPTSTGHSLWQSHHEASHPGIPARICPTGNATPNRDVPLAEGSRTKTTKESRAH